MVSAMGRPLRIEYPGAVYHITSRGNERKTIFVSDEDRIKFLHILEDYHERYGILLHSYVLMDNHYHLILETPKGNLLKVMHGINSRYTGYFNRTYRRAGHLFQGRYKGILIDKDNYLIELSRYVHLNPVRAKAVDRPEKWRWSSYLAYINKEREKRWVEYASVLSRFGSDITTARRRYKRFVEEGLTKELPPPLEDVHGQIVLGSEGFIEKIKRIVAGRDLTSEIIERKRFTKQPNPDEIIKEVAKAFGADKAVMKEKGKRHNTARKAAIYFIQRYSGLSNEEIGRIFGGIHYSAVSKASDRVKKEMAENKQFSKVVEYINSKFKA